MVIFPGESGLTGRRLHSPSPFMQRDCLPMWYYVLHHAHSFRLPWNAWESFWSNTFLWLDSLPHANDQMSLSGPFLCDESWMGTGIKPVYVGPPTPVQWTLSTISYTTYYNE